MQIAKQFNTDGATIVYWAKKYDLDRPLRGYWGKQI